MFYVDRARNRIASFVGCIVAEYVEDTARRSHRDKDEILSDVVDNISNEIHAEATEQLNIEG